MDLETVERFLAALAPEHTPVQAEMAAHAEREGFPIVGREAGGVLRVLARLTGGRAFEFGSGFGYSASWLLRGGVDEVVLTELDADELERGRDYLDRAGWTDRASFERGDAVEIVERYDGPFGVVLVDNEKERYVEAFEAVREKVAPGGCVVADNVTRGPLDFAALTAHVADGDPLPDDATRGIAGYLERVQEDPAFETTVLPVGNGLAVSARR